MPQPEKHEDEVVPGGSDGSRDVGGIRSNQKRRHERVADLISVDSREEKGSVVETKAGGEGRGRKELVANMELEV